MKNGKERNLEEKINILSDDWKRIIPKIKEKYKDKYDLILASAYMLDINNRIAEIACEFYKIK